MKVTFELDTDEPQQQDEAQALLSATDLRIALWDMEQLFRRAVKYEGFMPGSKEYLTEDQEEVVDKLRDEFHEILAERGLTKLVLEMP